MHFVVAVLPFRKTTDFLCYFGILVDVKHYRLSDSTMNFIVHCVTPLVTLISFVALDFTWMA